MKEILNNTLVYKLGEIIEEKINNRDEKENHENIIRRRNCKEFPVTSQQLGVYLDSIKNPDSIIYNIPVTFRLKENINVEKIKDSFIKVFESQEIFRTKYYEKEFDNGKTEIYGFVDDECHLEFEEYTFENVKEFVRPFDLTQAPLIRVGFIEDKVLLIDVHHIICDGNSMMIVINELSNQYNHNDNDVKELEIQFSDLAIDLYEKKNNEYFEKQIEFYRKMFNCDYDVLNLPKIKNNNECNKINIGYCEETLENSLCLEIDNFVKINEISKAVLFLTIYGYVLSKYSSQNTIYTSIINSNRNSNYTENMIGMFATTQPVILNFNDSYRSLTDTINENAEILFNIYENQDISFSELSSLLKLKTNNNSFIFQPKSITKYNSNNEIFAEKNRFVYSMMNSQSQTDNKNYSKFDILFYVFEEENTYHLYINYNSDIYEYNTINSILKSYIQ
eukprot:jgi/Orpsp1_1/1187089/evm.model.d7180000055325.1